MTTESTQSVDFAVCSNASYWKFVFTSTSYYLGKGLSSMRTVDNRSAACGWVNAEQWLILRYTYDIFIAGKADMTDDTRVEVNLRRNQILTGRRGM